MFVYELWVRVVGHEMLWSRVACKLMAVMLVELKRLAKFGVNEKYRKRVCSGCKQTKWRIARY